MSRPRLSSLPSPRLSALPLPRIGRTRLLLFLAMMGPGLITANADNDAGGIATYSIAGARFGYGMLWMLLLITFSLAVTQEMGARMGVVTGQGLAALIRERFRLKLTVFAMTAMLIANLGTTIAEFSGIATSFQLFGASKYYTVPFIAVMIWLLVVRGSYKIAERVFLVFSSFYLAYVVSGVLAHPDWAQALHSTVVPTFQLNSAYILLFIAVIGTTITPWGQFFIQAYVVDKGISIKHYRYTRAEVIMGAIVTDVVAFFIIVACAATIYSTGGDINSAEDAALALVPLAGQFASKLFAFGLLNASVLAAGILPLATAYAICEAFGFESGVNRSFKEAPIFHGIFTASIVVGALVALIPNVPLLAIMVLAQDVNGILLPLILIFVMVIVNDRGIMGKYANGRLNNLIAGTTTVALIILSVLLVITSFFT
ncbi:MAG: Nramp family divalent metal transporter [Actinobacteria bacterium]|nr:Nramp family divalent metal transporter [Actinomycetota bacterium]